MSAARNGAARFLCHEASARGNPAACGAKAARLLLWWQAKV